MLVAAWSKLVVQNVQNLCSRGIDYAATLTFRLSEQLIFAAAAVDGCFLVRNILAAL
jgi:hypothetical protein